MKKFSNLNKISSLIFLIVSLIMSDTISVCAVGDIMLGTTFPSEALPPNNGNDLFTETKAILQSSDLTFCNLEGTFLKIGKGVSKAKTNSGNVYVFRMPPSYSKLLKDAGFDLISLANNHANDFGDIGIKSTIKALEDQNLICTGNESRPFKIFKCRNHSIGFCSFCLHQSFKSINQDSIITMLDSICDLVIVSFHGGAEGREHKFITKHEEIFFNESRGNPYEFARHCVDLGGDIILGSGPHVTRAVEVYRDRFIAYSLGNFCTPVWFNLNNENGIAPIIKLRVNEKGKVLDYSIISICQEKYTGPQIDHENRALKEIEMLSRELK